MPKRASNPAVDAAADRVIDELARRLPCCPLWDGLSHADREQWRVDAAHGFVQAMGAVARMEYQVLGPPSVPPLDTLVRSVSRAALRRRAQEVDNESV
jgi:hypothetical protein